MTFSLSSFIMVIRATLARHFCFPQLGFSSHLGISSHRCIRSRAKPIKFYWVFASKDNVQTAKAPHVKVMKFRSSRFLALAVVVVVVLLLRHPLALLLSTIAKWLLKKSATTSLLSKLLSNDQTER
jgi:hypothetical protein